MSIEIRQLRCAAMTAEMMSFTQAANKLGIKQSTLGVVDKFAHPQTD